MKRDRRSGKGRTSLTVVTMKDLQKLSRNIAGHLSEEARKNFSLGICFDALVTILDTFMQTKEFKLDGSPKRLSDYLREELERRKQLSLPKQEEKKPEEEKKEENADPASNG